MRGILFALLIVAIALRRLDWWKLFDHAPRLMTGRSGFGLQAVALALTITTADDAEELAPHEGARLAAVLRHAVLRVGIEAAAFYGLVADVMACGLGGGDIAESDADLLAYLADAFAGGWGESVVYAVGCAAYLAARNVGRTSHADAPVAARPSPSDTELAKPGGWPALIAPRTPRRCT